MSNRSFVGGKVEIMGRDEILGWARRSRRQRIAALKTRAAAGDPRAIARLEKMQADLAAAIAPTTAPIPYATPTPYASPTPYAAVTYPQQNFQTPAYQSPYFNASLSQDPYGTPPQPTIDVFQGHDEILGSSFVGDDERAYASDGSMADKMALQRRITSSGYNTHQAYMRGTADADSQSRQAAKLVLQKAVDAKTIKRSDLKQAIELYSGANATSKEKVAVGSKMLEFLTKKQIKIEG